MEEMGSQELHVLAVDDSFVDRKVIERLLKISSCKVTLVESGRRALQYLGLDGEKKSTLEFSNMKVNLILTDYSMPGMTGYELLKKIKGSSAFNQIPVVIMSSENIVTRIDGCLEEGAEEFLMKPVKLSDVKRIRDFVLNGGGEGNVKKQTRKRKLCDDLASPASQKLSSPLTSSLSRDIVVASTPQKLASPLTSSPQKLPSPLTSSLSRDIVVTSKASSLAIDTTEI